MLSDLDLKVRLCGAVDPLLEHVMSTRYREGHSVGEWDLPVESPSEGRGFDSLKQCPS